MISHPTQPPADWLVMPGMAAKWCKECRHWFNTRNPRAIRCVTCEVTPRKRRMREEEVEYAPATSDTMGDLIRREKEHQSTEN